MPAATLAQPGKGIAVSAWGGVVHG